MNKYKELIQSYIQIHKEEIVKTLNELVKIPSVRGIETENAPFGTECAGVLDFTEALYRENGFKTELNNDKGYLLSYFGSGESKKAKVMADKIKELQKMPL